ncbi:TPA: hypothetical protein DIV55_06835 [Patescibacteria group bacterium]|uniref:Uncharacterized protein n=1 Tax=Candidatus Gottesmanbacteria bacterium GW2011_GWA1_43_11 TaxID=1618436 RepID=A0A0G1CIC5_9BACT|nr:MAG: hypothetical protein UV59_C0009G0016 [Candidatus Gottesmanbacteria bacterium GW2011_GWA1_43_11]HCS79420.1 hypothetical protein [Patescibacteria group bacterium]
MKTGKVVFPQLNKRQLEKLSDISSDIALVSLASVVLPAVFDRYNSEMVALGSIISLNLLVIKYLDQERR